MDGAVLGAEAFVLRYFGDDGNDRLLLVNLGRDLLFEPAPEPLLAPMVNANWTMLLSTEDPGYGGRGTAPVNVEERWTLPGQAAVVFAAK